MIVVRVKDGIVGHFAARLPEWVNAGIMASIGEALAGPGDTFATSHSYDGMAALASENVWGWLLMTVAGIRLFALAANGSFVWFKPFSPGARSLTAFMSVFVWFLIFSGMLYANPIGTGVRVYGGLMLSDMILAIVVAGEAGTAWWSWWGRKNGRR